MSVSAVRKQAARVLFDSSYPGFASFRQKWGVRGDATSLEAINDPKICSAIAGAIGSSVTGQPRPRSVVVLKVGELYYAGDASGGAEFIFDKAIRLLDFFIAPS